MTTPVDPLALLVPWLSTTLNVRAVVDLPSNLQDAVKAKPVVQVSHVNGADDLPTMVELTIDVDYYGPRNPNNVDASRALLSLLARTGHAAIRYGLRNHLLKSTGQAAVVFTVRTQTVPRPDDTYDDPNVMRYLSSYTIGFQAQPYAA